MSDAAASDDFCFRKWWRWLIRPETRRLLSLKSPLALSPASLIPNMDMTTPPSSEASDAPSVLYHNVPLEIKTSTRLLTLHCGSGKDPIVCSLTTVDLEMNPQYEALSYFWGSPNETASVLLDSAPVNVRENLWLALWHLRFVNRYRILWIDALCINQQNVRERNHQVGLMDRIYSKAAEVLVWLGPASGNSDKAMDCLADFIQVGNDFISSRRIDKGPEHREAVADLCKREYWRRMWILQVRPRGSVCLLLLGECLRLREGSN